MKYKYSGLYLKRMRSQKGLSQGKLADKFGYNSQFVSNWERGESFPPPHILKKLQKVLNLEKEYLENSLCEDCWDFVDFKIKDLK